MKIMVIPPLLMVAMVQLIVTRIQIPIMKIVTNWDHGKQTFHPTFPNEKKLLALIKLKKLYLLVQALCV